MGKWLWLAGAALALSGCGSQPERDPAAATLPAGDALRLTVTEIPAMKAVGVRELAVHLSGELSLSDAVDAVKQSTRNYAKRQLTWFRNQQRDWPRHPGFA